MRNPEGATQNAVLKAVRGARVARLVDRLKVVGTLGPDKLWRRATQPQPAAKRSPVRGQRPPPYASVAPSSPRRNATGRLGVQRAGNEGFSAGENGESWTRGEASDSGPARPLRPY